MKELFHAAAIILMIGLQKLPAQPPTLAGPKASVEVVAESGLVVYISEPLPADTYLLADTKAVIATEGTLRIHDAARKPDEFGFLVMKQQPLQVGTVYPMPVAEGQPLEWRIDVPSKGEWAVLVFGMEPARPQQPTLLTLVVGEVEDPDDEDDDDDVVVPEGPRVAVIIEEVKETTPQLADLYSDVREGLDTEDKLLVIDDDIKDSSGNTPAWAKAYLDAAGSRRPCLIVVDAATGAVAYNGDVPGTAAEALKIIGGDK